MDLNEFINMLAWGRTKGPSKEITYDGARQRFADPQMEALFQDWYANEAKTRGLVSNPDDPEHHYNYRAYFAQGKAIEPSEHYPSQFKYYSHPNAFVDYPGKPGFLLNTITGEFFLKPEYWERDKPMEYYTNRLDRKPRRRK